MKKIETIYSDHQILIVNKPAGIAVQSQNSSKASLHEILEKKYKQPIFITHRLDQVTSGVCIFAKNKKSCSRINEQLRSKLLTKKYLAIVEKGKAKESDKLTYKLIHDKKLRKAFVNKKGKPSFLTYRKIATSDNYDLLAIEIETGRFHQIRAILAAEGFPVKGDVKYGARRSNKDRSIHLHAYNVTFKHPKTKEIASFSAPLPSENLWQYFDKLIHTQEEE